MENLVIPAQITVEVLQDGAASRAGHVSGEAGGATLDVYTSMYGEATPAPARTARVFGFADGELTGAMDLSWTEADNGLSEGEATWTLELPLPQPSPPPEAGLGFQRWGPAYDLSVDRVDLGELLAP